MKDVRFNKRFKVDKKNDFQEKSFKTREDYIEEHPHSLNGHSAPEYEPEDMGEFHFTNGDYNNKEKFDRKADRLIKEKKKI